MNGKKLIRSKKHIDKTKPPKKAAESLLLTSSEGLAKLSLMLKNFLRLNNEQKRAFINVSIAVGQVIFASMVLPFVVEIPGLDRLPIKVLLSGVFLTVLFLGIIPYFLAKKLKS